MRNDALTYALKHLSTYALLLLLFACRDSRTAWGPEDLLFNSIAENAAFVETTIGGVVACPTCAPDVAMIIEVWNAQTTTFQPLTSRPYEQLGPYQIALRLAEKTVLTIRAHIFGAAGSRVVEQSVTVPEGNAAAALTVNFQVP